MPGPIFQSVGTAATKNVGTAAGNVVQLDGSGKLPAVDGSQLTGVSGGGGGTSIGGAVTGGTPPFPLFTGSAGLAQSFPFTPMVENPTIVPIYSANTASGDVDLYTVPAGKRAFVMQSGSYNQSGGSITSYYQAKISGAYYRLTSGVALGTLAAAINVPGIPIYVWEAGEIVSVNLSASGLNINALVVVFNNTSSLKCVKLTSLSSGNNTLYTVPAGKTILGLSLLNSGQNPGQFKINVVNSSGVSLNYYSYFVPTGASIGNDTRIQPIQAIATGVLGALTQIMTAGLPGDVFVVNSSGSGAQFVYSPVMEF